VHWYHTGTQGQRDVFHMGTRVWSASSLCKHFVYHTSFTIGLSRHVISSCHLSRVQLVTSSAMPFEFRWPSLDSQHYAEYLC
jgi:hypothetical protein